ncbi:prephenate dehydratase [Saccharibacter sp. 17.LH.SD]|uniref:prephenate dehydratase n=1 Tax=Saccharibacter sp. 17.LH.SD TaxID=2689393 RepID=UPI0013697A97|nr:prephenate dehydratase [Saccharibacter sp. 17.LH.SD]MXV44222.1 prephenate dehydratase [Saccharibacter sp. 17.LH.SD]
MPVIAFQGRPGAYSDLACRAVRPGWETLPCRSFAETIDAVRDGQADEGLLPCENSLAGRVAEIHALLPHAGLKIVGEHFQRVEHCLLGVKGATIGDIRRVHTHPVAMAQVRNLLREYGFEGITEFDTAGAAEMVARWGNPEDAAVASSLAGELNGLEVLKSNVEDATHNTTRFYRVTRQEKPEENLRAVPTMTTMLVHVQNIPGSLYEVLGCFSRYGVNMTRIESYMLGGSFAATQFLVDVEGHPEEERLRKALEALAQEKHNYRILGVYQRSEFREALSKDHLP